MNPGLVFPPEVNLLVQGDPKKTYPL
ncbi:unnamed protein product, partial [Didymodactylos carnosus]